MSRRRKNWLKTTIAMITLVATVLETGFSSVAAYAAVLDNDDSVLLSEDAGDVLIDVGEGSDEDVLTDTGSDDETGSATEINISAPADEEDIASPVEETKTDEVTAADKEAELDVSDSGISGSGYDEISVIINTDNLDRNDNFKVKFVGADTASYNPVLNDQLDKTNGGRYTFDSLSGEGFSIRATSADNVILSYNYTEDGEPVITAATKTAQKVLTTRILTAVDDRKISAIEGEGYEAVTVKFDTDNLSDKRTFALYVESEAAATVNGEDASKGINGLDSSTGSVKIEGLSQKRFIAYAVTDRDDMKISSAASADDVENGIAVITVDNLDTKRVYEFEDDKVAVTAILQKPDAVPDDAYFAVTPLSEDEAKAYLAALNANLEEGQSEVTADDILLYDIGFYKDETKSEEIEPEEGSVSVSIEFKNSQITDELGVEDGEYVQVTHFEEEGNGINPVAVEAKTSTLEEKVDFTVDSFSVYGIWATTMANVKAGKTVSYSDVLNDAVNYGIVANEMTLAGHMESNFAVSKMHGSAQIQSNKNNGGGAGRVYIGEYDDNSHTFLMDKNGNSGVLQIVTTEDVLNRFDPAMKKRDGVVVDIKSMSKDQIQKKVSGMVDVVRDNSDALMQEINCYQYGSIVKNGCVDFTSKPAGTYYISFDTSDGKTENKFPGSNYEIRINSDQNVVLNIPDEKVSFGQYRLYIDGIQKVPQGNSDEEILFEKLIFNCPNATWAETNGPVTGTFLLPRADFYNNSVAAGFLVAKNIKRIGGSEWHCISRNIEIVEDDKTRLDLGVTKIFKDGNGNIVDDGLWPDDGFTFKISKYLCNDQGDANGAEVERDPRYIPNLNDAKETVTIYRDTPGQKASFGYFEFKGKEVYDNSRAKVSGTYPNTKYLCFMYKIVEVKGETIGVHYVDTPRYIKVFVNSQKITDGNYTKYYVWTETKVNDNVKYYNCKPDLIEFVNTYCPQDVPVDLEGIKKVNGQTDIVPDDTFTFNLYKYNKKSAGFETTPIQTKKNKSYTIKFDTMKLKFEEAPFFSNSAGASKSSQAYYYFLIKEDPSVPAPYVYDKSVYVAKVTLIKDYNTGKINPKVEYYRFDDEKSMKQCISDLTGGQTKCVEFKATDLEFDNTYTAKGSTKLYGHKKLENRKFKEGDTFTFTLTPVKTDDVFDDHNKAQTITITPKASDNYEYDFDFNELTYTLEDAGKTYTYTLAETRGNDKNIEYSTVTYNVKVSVKDNGNGTLTVTPDGATQKARAKFTNIYKAKGDVQFFATKRYKSGSALEATKKFSFVLKDVTDPKAPVTLETKEVTGQDTAVFKKIDYADITKVGTYKYTINEVLPKEATAENNYTVDGIIYDHRIYNITVVVSDNTDGTLATDITGAYDTGEKAEKVVNPVFINDYRVDEISVPVGGTKELHGKDLERGEFTFNLAAADNTTSEAIKAGSVVMPETVSVKNGVPETLNKNAFEFGDIVFKAAGTYKFLITEEEGNEEGIVYSGQKYLATIVIRDNGNGKLEVASQDFKKDDIVFINTKNGKGSVPFYARKVLIGRKLEAGQFSFELRNSAGDLLETKANDASGYASFTPIRYYNNTETLKLDKPGDKATFDYTISEVIPDPVPKGYSYDDHKEDVHVTVTLEADGSLTAVADNATLNVPAVFNNEYNAKGEVEIDGIKKITGRKFLKEDEGKFFAELYDSEGSLVESVPITKDTRLFGEHGGEFKFSPLKFTRDDLRSSEADGGYLKQIVREYTVKETGSSEGVTMDQTVYDVTVTVTDKGDGTLNVQKEYSLDGKPLETITFVNKFNADGSTQFVARKVVDGTVLEGKQFSFILEDAAGKTIDTQKNGDGGEIIFKELTYDQDDVEASPIEYKIYEDIKDRDGYTLDSRIYTAKAFITLKDDATIDVENKYYDEKGEEVPEANVIFRNIYNAEGEVDLYVYKKLTGRDLDEGKFTFELKDESGNTIDTAANPAAGAGEIGKASFKTIEFTQKDLDAKVSHQVDKKTYARYYTINEVIPDDAVRQPDGTYKLDGYTYDSSVYNVVVTLEDKGDGKITTDWYAYKTGTQPEKPSLWDKIVEFVTGKGADKNALFENYYEARGAIELGAHKILTGKELKAKDFAFTLTGKNEDGKAFTDTKENNANGNAEFDRILYTKPGDYEYEIREVIPKDAEEENGEYVLNGVKYDGNVHTVKVAVTDPGTGKLTVSASIDGASAVISTEVTETDGKVTSLLKCAPVEFKNSYECKPIDITLGGDKTLVGRDLADENEFSFNMKSAKGNPKAFDQTVVINRGINGAFGEFAFDKITFTFEDMKNADGVTYASQKVFEYVITEVIPDDTDKLEGVTYDPSVYNVAITVTNSNGKLIAKITSNEAEVEALKAASFVNTYNAENTLRFPVKKLVAGTDDTDKEFTFELTGDVESKLTTTAVNNQISFFAPIEYKLSDIKNPDGTYSREYNYTVSEVPGDYPGYSFSGEVYYINVKATSDGKSGVIDLATTITKNGATYLKYAMEFTNTYKAEGEVDIDGTKELVGRELKDGEFDFALSQRSDVPDANNKYSYTLIEKKSNVNGKFSFKLKYDRDDIGNTYYYTVNEIIPDGASDGTIDYDKSVYDITVSVADNKDGTLKVTKDIKKGNAAYENCPFINKEIKPSQLILEAEKTLEGKALENDEFTFTLTGSGQDQSVTNKGERVVFDAIEYSYKDIGKKFTYKVEEKGKSGDGITYDATQYTVEVNVTGFDEDRNVVYTKEIKANGNIVNEIRFKNIYRSEAKVQFGGHKFLEGFENEAIPLGTYSFELLDKNGNRVQVDNTGKIVSEGGKEQLATVIPKKASDPTEYSFDEIRYDQDDYEASALDDHKFTYTVKEVIPVFENRAANVTYAANTYNITVRLYKDERGLIQAETTTKEGVSVKNLDFTNKYAAENEVIIDGIKTIEGKDLENAAYTFELKGEGEDQTVVKEAVNTGNTFAFEKIAYDAKDIGVHTYTVTETASKDGSVIDTSVFTVMVTVGEGKDGKLAVSKAVSRKDKDGNVTWLSPEEPITFNNKYAAKGVIDIEGIKIMHNKPIKAGDYRFVLKDLETGKVIETVTTAAAPLNNKDDLEAQAAFKFSALEFTQEDLKSADGKSYLSETRKYYSVEEENTGKGGVKYSDASYIVEVTIRSNKTDMLEVSRKIGLKNKSGDYTEEKTGLIDSLKLLFADDSKYEHQIIFENTYDSECIIDPPILRKQIFGKKIERGEFEFRIEGPGLKSMGEEKTGYIRLVKNGINSTDGSIYYSDGREIPLGEIFVGDIKYKYTDLDINLETGEASREFVYHATEVPGEDKSIEYSPQVFELTVKAVDDNEGHMYTVPPIDGLKWVPLTPFTLSDEEMSDTFINTRNSEGSINIVGVKRMTGRSLNKDDRFEFTLTDDQTGATVTRTNTEDENGVPGIVAFNAKDKDGNVDIAFLNYRYGTFEANPDRAEGVSANLIPVDDTGIHTYTISENSINRDGIKCDTASFKVYVDVQTEKDEKGNDAVGKDGHIILNAKVVKVEKVYSDNNKVEYDFANNNYFEFVNEFKATGSVEFTGSKFVNDQFGKDAGLAGTLKDKYNFAIYQYSDEARTQDKTLIDVKGTDAAGKFTLTIPEYDQEVLKNEKGEYEGSRTLYYRIIETKPANGSWTENNTVFESDGIVYDNTEYDADVTVAYDGTPALKVTKSIKKAATGEPIPGVIFTNVESAEFTDIKGTKTWVDKVKDPSSRPDVVIDLYSSAVGGGKKVINTYTIKAPAATYEFSKDSAGDPLPKFDSNGKTIKYTVSERAINGYLSEQKGYDFYNTRGTVKIQKIDTDTGEPLSGATLAIYDGKTQVEKWISSNSAHVVENDLTAGKSYTLRELAAPDGYELAGDISFTVPANGSDITVTMSDKPIIGSVRLVKQDSETRKALAGAEFSLYTNNGTRIYATGSSGKYKVTSATSNGVFAVSSSGSLEITDLPKGTYYFVETKAPEGYVLSSEKLSFTIADSSRLVEVTYLNKESVGAVKLRKVGSTGTRGLAGAEFELYARTPRTSGQAISSTIYPEGYYRYGTYTTDSSGEIRVNDLPWDDYYFVETKAPEGYTIAKDAGGETLAYTFTVDASSAGTTIDLGDIVNNPEDIDTGVLGERVPPEEKASGVLGVRSAPKKGVLGTRVGPATGDASAIALWLTLLVACVGTIIWMLAGRRKKAPGKQ